MSDRSKEELLAEIAELRRQRDAFAERQRESEAQLHEILSALPDILFILDRDGRYVHVFTRHRDLLLEPEQALLGKTVEEMLPGALAQQVKSLMEETLTTQRKQEMEYQLTVDGQARWFQGTCTPLRFADQDCVLWVTRDVTERKRAEAQVQQLNQALRQRAAELETAYAELESFSYSVSHDLRAPLRALGGFSALLGERCADRLDERGRDYLDHIRRASERMSRLIEALLSLSRMSRSEMRIERCDMSAMARAVADELRGSQAERHVDMVIADGIQVLADPTLLRVALENLLGNAWKFTGKQPQARIELSRTRHAGQDVYFVRDNGAGFDMEQVGRLFGAFERLHHESEFEGTGIGLATVKRILLRHGGEIWAEGQPGQGATFLFTLPDTLTSA